MPRPRRGAVEHCCPPLNTQTADDTTRTLLTQRATTDDDATVRRAAVQVLARGWPNDTTSN